MANPPVQLVEQAVYELCPLINSGKLSLDDAQALGEVGFSIDLADEEGKWASARSEKYVVRIGTDAGKPGCRVRYFGQESVSIYEAVRDSALKKSFAYPDGKRKPPEAQFVLDTLVSESGPIGIISMFRLSLAAADSFAMTIFPPVS